MLSGLPVARLPLLTLCPRMLFLGDSYLDQMYFCLDHVVSKKTKDNQMQETTRQLNDSVKTQSNH